MMAKARKAPRLTIPAAVPPKSQNLSSPVVDDPKAAQIRIRLSVDVAERVDQRVNDLSERFGVPRAEIVRQALDFLLLADDAAQQGYQVGAFRERKGMREEVRFAGVIPLDAYRKDR
jgi:hypothetical protein